MDTSLPRRAAIHTGKIDVGRAPCNAYVVFKEVQSARAALAANMQEVESHHIRVDLATPRSAAAAAATAAAATAAAGGTLKARSLAAEAAASAASSSSGNVYDPTRSVFIGNLNFQTTDEELIQIINSQVITQPELADAVEAVRVVRDRQTNVGKVRQE